MNALIIPDFCGNKLSLRKVIYVVTLPKIGKPELEGSLFYFRVYALPIKPGCLLCLEHCQGKVEELQKYALLVALEEMPAAIEFIGHSFVHPLRMPKRWGGSIA